MARLIVLDYGTSALKAAIYGDQFERLALESRAWTYSSPRPGWMECTAEDYWTNTVSAVRALLARAGGAGDVAGISVTAQAETMIALDARGEALRPAIVWLDTRAQKQCASVSARYDAFELYRRTGNAAFDPVMPLVKQMWLKENEPDVYRRTWRFMLLKEYIVYRLTGEIVGEATVNCCSGYFDIARRAWDDGLLDAARIDRRKLPEPMDSLLIVGGLCARAREALGLPENVRVVNGMLDQCASALGAGNARPGMVCETTGTALAIAATFRDFLPEALPERVLMFCHALQGRYLALPNCPTAGAALEWFRSKLLSGEERAAGFALIDARVAERAGRPEGPTLLAHMCGRLSPRPNAALRGSLHNITLETDRFDIARAVMEGVAFMLKQNVDLLARCGAGAKEITSLGGGARSGVWLQMKANALEMPVRTLADAESTALGCALGMGLALGLIPNEDALGAYVRPGKTYLPDPAQRDAYRARYQTYVTLDM